MSSLLIDALQSSLGASEPWPDDVALFQQYQIEQITLPDYAQCLAVEAVLHMNGLKFRVDQRTNAEEMSPSGKVPFVQVGPYLVSEFDPITAFVSAKGFCLSKDLSDTERAEMKAYISMVENILGNAEHYMAWLVPEIADEVTKPRYGCSYPWPLRWVLPWRKQREVRARLQANDWADKTMKEVCEEVRVCCEALAERLEKKDFFFGTKPTELDAVVFGHLYTILTTRLPGGHFMAMVQDFKNLAEFCKRIEDSYFNLRFD